MKSHMLTHTKIGSKEIILSTMFPQTLTRRLAELGVFPGSEIMLLRVSPAKDLYVCKIRNAYQLILRKEQAKQIFLTEEGVPNK